MAPEAPGAPGPVGRAARLLRTVRHLRPGQVWGRAWFRVHRPRPDLSPPPPLAPPSPWIPPAHRSPSFLPPDTVRFLNEEARLSETGWDPPDRSHLWRYNLHYFDDLSAEGAAGCAGWHASLITEWIAANPPGHGTGWEPYPTSLRLVNWAKWALAGHVLPPEAPRSLATQARWLRARLERHLGGNHLLSNAKALLFASALFQGPEAMGWRRTALAILGRELPRQVLPDGGHFELSPMYHALAVEDLLDLLNLAQGRPDLAAAAEAWRARLPAMLAWLAALSHPDGRIAFFNDAAFGIAPENAEILAYAARLGLPAPPPPDGSAWLPHSGYARLAAGDAVLLADLARVGPDELPGHAHADTLSFELSLGPERVVVNGGTSIYGTGPERLRQRGTAAHSTVTLDGRDSSEVWSGFRVGRRARVAEARVAGDGPMLRAEGTHDGYAHRPGRPLHHRAWTLSPTGLVVADRLPGDAVARFHLHPGATPRPEGESAGRLRLASGREIRWQASGPVRIEPSTWHPEFGRSVPAASLVLPLRQGELRLALDWD